MDTEDLRQRRERMAQVRSIAGMRIEQNLIRIELGESRLWFARQRIRRSQESLELTRSTLSEMRHIVRAPWAGETVRA
jgi:hypothetical protein